MRQVRSSDVPITRPHRRKDGSRRRTTCARTLRASTGLCDAPSVDAELVDSAVINRLDGYLDDFGAWRASIEAGQGGGLTRPRREVERAERAPEDKDAVASPIATDYERRLSEGDQAGPTRRGSC
jgi:hypothetical protein